MSEGSIVIVSPLVRATFICSSVVNETTAIQPLPVITEEGDESAKFNNQHF